MKGVQRKHHYLLQPTRSSWPVAVLAPQHDLGDRHERKERGILIMNCWGGSLGHVGSTFSGQVAAVSRDTERHGARPGCAGERLQRTQLNTISIHQGPRRVTGWTGVGLLSSDCPAREPKVVSFRSTCYRPLSRAKTCKACRFSSSGMHSVPRKSLLHTLL